MKYNPIFNDSDSNYYGKQEYINSLFELMCMHGQVNQMISKWFAKNNKGSDAISQEELAKIIKAVNYESECFAEHKESFDYAVGDIANYENKKEVASA